MRLPATIRRTFQAAVILYAVKIITALIVVLPVWVFLNGKFGLSLIADGFWPIPDGLQLIELFWQVRELAVVMILLLLIAGLLYFLAAQFVYGGICAEALKGNGFSIASFCHNGGKYFGGFIKIALAAIPFYVIIFLVVDLIGLFIGKVIGVIAGETSAAIITILIIFLAIYCLAGYLIILRFIQININKSSLRLALKYSKLLMKTQIRRFLALNLFAGLLTSVILSIAFLLISSIYEMKYSFIAALLMVIVQQLMIFLGSYFEVMQIFINTRIMKEYNYGT